MRLRRGVVAFRCPLGLGRAGILFLYSPLLMTYIDPHWEYLMSARWTYDQSSHLIQDTNGKVIVRCNEPAIDGIDPEWNAWVLAAAPELLHVLDSILHLLETHASHVYYRDFEVTYADYIVKKATGEHLED